MEPFGLFQFLQSLLKTPPAQETKEEETAAEISPEQPVTPTQTPNNEAYLHFIETHNRRMRNTKKH